MATVGAYEAKTHLPELLKRVENGESITITRHGHPVAQLVPPGAAPARDARQVIHDIKRFGEGHTLGPDLTIRQLIDEGRSR
jgi:prevent-host-death family protein